MKFEMAQDIEDGMASSQKRPLYRYFISTRSMEPQDFSSLLQHLKPSESAASQRFVFPKDRHMSLASWYLKYFIIHLTCAIPWSSINISKTPPPHHKPHYMPISPDEPGVSFNVSHQAGIVALVGRATPAGTEETEIGVDVVCVNEERRRKDFTSDAAFAEWVDPFTEVFSKREIADMKGPIKETHGQPHLTAKVRRFYAYWAFKEAYVKMTGEALIASWLKELEFREVRVPAPVTDGIEPERGGAEIWLHGKRVEDVILDICSLEDGFMIATALKQPPSETSNKEALELPSFKLLNIKTNIVPHTGALSDCSDMHAS